MGFALVVFKEHAWRAVQLGHDDTLGAIDHKRTFVGHQGHFAHVDFLLLDFLDHLGLRCRGLAVINDQLDFGAYCRCECQTTGLAFAHVKGGFGQVVFDKLHLDKPIVRNDRERIVERRL